MAAIPQPKTDPLLGNLRAMDPVAPVQGLMRLAQTLGPVFQLEFFGVRTIFFGSQALVNELCDESRFEKKIHAPLKNIRALAGDGLFTAYNAEPNWSKAHRLLMPAFGPIGIRDMFDPMLDIAEQMMVRWERFGESAVIDVADNMTRLTLDTIALCAFDYRFNSFYQNEMHPFVGAMVDALKEAGARGRRPQVANKLMLATRRKFDDDIRMLHGVADTLIAERRRLPADPSRRRDLLDLMLEGRDPLTGEGLSDENIRYQLVTFLIAGHETTSGLLSFALYLLMRNPEVLAKARAEVDAALGRDTPSVGDLPKMKYLEQVLMETLRIWPTAPAIGLKARQDTTVGGQYAVTRDDVLMVLIPQLHRDPAVWGEDAEAFRPERFAPDAFAALPPNAWKPFGNGARACIGRPFAMQEAQLVLALILQRFELIPADPAYRLKVAETLTLKPDGFHIRVRRRGDAPFAGRSSVPTAPSRPLTAAPTPAAVLAVTHPAHVLTVLYGSNTGSSEAFAKRIAGEAAANGWRARVAPMDEAAGALSTEGATIVVTASYEGQPPDNARQFVAWVESLPPGALAGLRYAVFGCGNRQWTRTWQAIPKRVDAALERAGGSRFKALGETDANGDFFGGFDAWYGALWPELGAAFGREPSDAVTPAPLAVTVVKDGRTALLHQADLHHGEIAENRELVDMSSPLGRSKRHLEIVLPEGMTYRTGDYLAVLPRNPRAAVERALRRFGFAADTQLVVEPGAGGHSTLPTGHPISADALLSDYVELAQPATRAQVQALAQATRCPPEKAELVAMGATPEAYEREVLDKRVSVLDLLERFASCEPGFAAFLAMLPPMRARQYSISSSPLRDPQRCTLTVAVVDAPAQSGQGRFQGVASTWLAGAASGARIPVAVRPSNTHFHPPASPETPMVMVCAGTGLAPFRGFVQERAIQAAGGRAVGPALLFFGCDHPDVDWLYREEFERWEKMGVVSVRPAFHAKPEGDVSFVQHRLWQDRAEVADLFRRGAHLYVCGDGKRMAPAVRDTFLAIYREGTGASEADALAWAERFERETGRYVADVFA